MFFIVRWIRYFLMEFLGYQGVWLKSTIDKRNRFNEFVWVKSSPVFLTLDTDLYNLKWWFYTNKEYRDNFHNSSMAFIDRERDA